MADNPIPEEPMEWTEERMNRTQVVALGVIILCLLAIIFMVAYYLAGGAW